MKVTKAKLKAIINEELQAELNEGVIDFFKRLFGVAKPTEDSKEYLARVERAIQNPRFKGYPSICNREHVWCPEKDRCSPYCGKNPADMKAKITALANSANRAT